MIIEYLPIVAILALVLIMWSNYLDMQLIKQYQLKRTVQTQKPCDPVYPWWHGGLSHGGFPHGGFRVGPWNWSRQQHYYHPGVGWYASPFPLG